MSIKSKTYRFLCNILDPKDAKRLTNKVSKSYWEMADSGRKTGDKVDSVFKGFFSKPEAAQKPEEHGAHKRSALMLEHDKKSEEQQETRKFSR